MIVGWELMTASVNAAFGLAAGSGNGRATNCAGLG